MARGRKKGSTETLDEKIEQQKAVLEKAKAKYETEKENLAELIKLRNEMRKEELMEAPPVSVQQKFHQSHCSGFVALSLKI